MACNVCTNYIGHRLKLYAIMKLSMCIGHDLHNATPQLQYAAFPLTLVAIFAKPFYFNIR